MAIGHEPGEHPMWQESLLYLFHDEETGVGGTGAFGSFASQGTGLTWVGAYGDGWTFQRSSDDIALTGADRTDDTLGVGGVRWTQLGEGRWRVEVDDPDASFELELTDLYPAQSWHHGPAAQALADLGAGHVEASCTVTGSGRVGGRTYDIEGLGHRDNSWGPRTLDVVRNHRWVAGTCGPALSFSLEALHLADGSVSIFGFVVRDGERSDLSDVQILVTLDHDGLTPRHYECHVTLDDGGTLTLASERIHAVLHNHRGPLTAIDAPARVRCGELRGIADLNLIANPLAGSAAPTLLLGGSLGDGLHTPLMLD